MDAHQLGVRLLGDLIDHADDAILLFRRDGVVVFANPATEFVVGWPPAELVGRNLGELAHPDEFHRASVVMSQSMPTGGAEQRTPGLARFRQPDGSYRPIEIGGSVLRDHDGKKVFSMICRRVDDRLTFDEVLNSFAADPDLRRSLEPVARLLRWRPDAPLFTLVWRDEEGRHSVGDDLPPALVGLTPPESDRQGSRSGAAAEPGSPWEQAWRSLPNEVFSRDLLELSDELRELAETSGLTQFRLNALTDLDGGVRALTTLWRPAGGHPLELFDEPLSTAGRLAELAIRWNNQQSRLRHDASHDHLTGLANRRVFLGAIDEPDQPVDTPGSVLYIDLDGFKPINDEYGHDAGDRVLVEVARRLRDATRPGDVVARMGGDEFAIACAHCEVGEAEKIAERLLRVLREPIAVRAEEGEVSVTVTASIGVAMSPEGLSLTLAGVADQALYDAKARGGATAVRAE